MNMIFFKVEHVFHRSNKSYTKLRNINGIFKILDQVLVQKRLYNKSFLLSDIWNDFLGCVILKPKMCLRIFLFDISFCKKSIVFSFYILDFSRGFILRLL